MPTRQWRADGAAGVRRPQVFSLGTSKDPVFFKSVGECVKMQKTKRKWVM